MKVKHYNKAEKKQIVDMLVAKKEASNLESDAKFANSIELNKTTFSQIKSYTFTNKRGQELLSHKNWVRLARMVGFERVGGLDWYTANTITTETIYMQLQTIQHYSLTGIFCDVAGIGKTHTCKYYCDEMDNAFYINCGDAPKKRLFIRKLARTLGFDTNTKQDDLLMDVIYYLKTLENPMLIFDEAGDLEQTAILVLKRLYNELEFECGMYLIGAEGLQKKLDTGVRLRRNGYEEVFSRFGRKYASVVPRNGKEKADYFTREARKIIEAQGIDDADMVKEIIGSCVGHDLRRVRKEVQKYKISQLATV